MSGGWQATQGERVELVLSYARTLGFTPTADQDRRIRQALSEVPVPLLVPDRQQQGWGSSRAAAGAWVSRATQRAMRRVLRRWHRRRGA